jgi:ATP-dependent Zn protease
LWELVQVVFVIYSVKQRKKAPSIIFIDEIVHVGRADNKQPSFSTNDEREYIESVVDRMDSGSIPV